MTAGAGLLVQKQPNVSVSAAIGSGSITGQDADFLRKYGHFSISGKKAATRALLSTILLNSR
jgi:hypothetical protein